MFGRRCIALLILALGCIGGTNAHAAGTVRQNWVNCTGPVVTTVEPGDAVTAFVSVLGQDEAHKGAEVRLTLQAPTGLSFPDAWRFDPAGCQPPGLLVIGLGSTAFCPRFFAVSGALQANGYDYDPLTDGANLHFSATYPTSATPDPAVRYTIFTVRFDHAVSSDGPTVPGAYCGGLSTPICIAITGASWLRSDGVQVPFQFQPTALTVNDPENHVCAAATPVRTETWGAIRQMYRR